jgi:hypothetical protein
MSTDSIVTCENNSYRYEAVLGISEAFSAVENPSTLSTFNTHVIQCVANGFFVSSELGTPTFVFLACELRFR